MATTARPKGRTAAPGPEVGEPGAAALGRATRVHKHECTINTVYLKELPFCPKFYKNKQNSEASNVKKKKKKANSFSFKYKTQCYTFRLSLELGVLNH